MVMAPHAIPKPLPWGMALDTRRLIHCAEFRCPAAKQPNHTGEPVLALPVIRVDDLLSRNLERQASIAADIGCKDAQVVAAAIEIAGEFADTDRTDDVGRRKPEGDN